MKQSVLERRITVTCQHSARFGQNIAITLPIQQQYQHKITTTTTKTQQ